ncbi:thiamine biosynthesis lipoprotein [Aurantimicrobium minutum]|uniref:FAD:protein FMN transferase n=1 Tax=Aurantimicrobium minutum TaxID=708131 RepID=UPI00247617A8|nr:FAD:protein FMN transferase [Aurantimicrobium minutum]MDH6532393.1 thiamine biosynthesis lipoprotein [Aurantimicrobium minutum]
MSVHAFETMGTMVSIRIADTALSERDAQAAVTAVEQECGRLNEKFSLYRDDSELSQIARGELTLANSSDDMRTEYARALEWREKTDGAFTPHRPDGVIDLNGTIKAVAIDSAAQILTQAGFQNFSVNVGGDLTTSGDQSPEEQGWITGIVDPADRAVMLAAVRVTAEFPAMATSGTSERGEHIWARPETTTDFVQATVMAGDIITADVLATAIISGGQATLDQITQNFAVAVLTVAPDGALQANARFQELVAR